MNLYNHKYVPKLYPAGNNNVLLNMQFLNDLIDTISGNELVMTGGELTDSGLKLIGSDNTRFTAYLHIGGTEFYNVLTSIDVSIDFDIDVKLVNWSDSGWRGAVDFGWLATPTNRDTVISSYFSVLGQYYLTDPKAILDTNWHHLKTNYYNGLYTYYKDGINIGTQTTNKFSENMPYCQYIGLLSGKGTFIMKNFKITQNGTI